MGNVRLGVPEALALALRDALGLRAFVETGTYRGGTTTWASEHFARVVTIEGYLPRYEKTTAALSHLANVRWVSGDSRLLLADELAALDEPVLLWLDAHWCGNAEHSHAVGDECPLREELTAVNASRHAAEHAILIDDARLFTAPPPYPHDPAQWPRYAEVEAELLACGDRAIAVVEDVIVAVPRRVRDVVEAYTPA